VPGGSSDPPGNMNLFNWLKSLMPKRKRIHSGYDIHFVTFSVNKHIPVFRESLIARSFIENLDFYSEKGLFRLHAYVVMPDHVHLLMELPDNGKISDLVRDIKKYFSYRVKNKLSRDTNLDLRRFFSKGNFQFWERGFDEVTIRSEYVYKIKLEYIINNPVKAGLVNKSEDYPFLFVGRFEEMRI